tara:strand:+ start:554 stop:853 length:300 start_codon:yes stop_codon:yes gene_type:complete
MVQTRSQTKTHQQNTKVAWPAEATTVQGSTASNPDAEDNTTILLGAPPAQRLSFSDLASQLWGIHINRLLTQVQEGAIDQEDLTEAEYKACYVAMTQGS